ncbi:hypothetical protein BS47DRAFT_1371689 [Hydnum rufescens UP504]|uniref:non-specific serine/threonine protein kinase n=1 Tax=Hydnum rufescens UP504 TaxID=1448309 RepID=A0A9P6B2P7_9AGAM|nr:hypothetical protein BS47DRAFT_1371689 [Hydnum rufescens UP504]
MGNTASGATARTGGALDSYVSELGADIIYEKSLGSSRFLKTVRGRHRNGPVIVKMFIKHDPMLSLRTYQKRLKAEREALTDIPNIYNYQSFLETERAGYIIRQWLANNLYDRISTRPFLSLVEKKWIAFQLVHAMKDVRARKVAHGDIKSENILVTSWNWVYITDFASFKPVHLPEDDPADYSFYFDASGRRTCYIAPERFYAADDKSADREGPVTEAMDVFSLGCVLAELFLDGRDTFTLSQLFKYRAKELNMESHLSAIEDDSIRSLISQMITLDPAARPSFEDLLDHARDVAFPESFYSFLHNYVIAINETSSPSPFTKPVPLKTGVEILPGTATEHWNTIPTDSDHRIERIWADFDSVEPLLADERVEETVTELVPRTPVSQLSSRAFQEIFPVEVHIPNRSSQLRKMLGSGRQAATEDGPALIILSLVSANVRNCASPGSKVKALDLLLALAPFLTDESKLDRLVPYVVDLLKDDVAIVRASAIRTLTQVVMLVSAITASNASLFPEYILPNARYIGRDSEVMVRAMYAQCLVPLGEAGIRFLEMSQAIKAHGTVKSRGAHDFDATFEEDSYDTRLRDLQLEIEEQIVGLLVDPSSVVKRAILHDTPALCVFFGRQKTNDVVLSHMITYLNDRDWLLRYAFFDSIVAVAACVGSRSLEEYILPLMIQALSDMEETVVAKVLNSLTSLAELGLFEKLRIWELMSAATGFLYHPNIWIREGAAAFISSSAKHLPVTDVWCILYPSLRPLLRSDIRAISEQSLLMTVKPHLPRAIFDAAVAWAMKADNTLFWNPQQYRTKISKFDVAKDSSNTPRKGKTSSRSGAPRSDEDNTQLHRLEQSKIILLRDYILKLAQTTRSFASRSPVEILGIELAKITTVGLQTLGIVPQTVFLNGQDSSSATGPDDLMHQDGPFDHAGPYGDLRRKLAQMDGSVLSLNPPASSNSPRIPESDKGALSPRPASSLAETDVSRDFLGITNRPSSPSAESLISNQTTAVHSALHTSKRGIHVGNGRKAAPAVGTVNTTATATGVLEAAVKLRADLEHDEASGRSSPMHMGGPGRRESKLRMAFPAPPSTTYAYIQFKDGQEPAITNVLEHVYHDNFREGFHDFGPRILHGPIRRRQPIRAGLPPRDVSAIGRRSEATLIANLTAHGSCVNDIAVSPDQVFFVSCSDDRSAKVWDTARLERNVTSKPRHVYNQHHARVTCICMVEASHCFVSAAEDGSVHVVRVHVSVSGSLPKYGKLQIVREHRLDHPGEFITSMQHYNTEISSNLLYTTTHSSVVILDLRTMRVLQQMSNPVHFGVITCTCVDSGRTWLVTGTQGGILTLWDLRFGLRLRSWRVGTSSGSQTPMSIHQCVIHPTAGKRTLVVVAISPRSLSSQPSSVDNAKALIEVWDISKPVLVESFATREVSDPHHGLPSLAPTLTELETSVQPEMTTPADAIAAFVRARKPGRGGRTPSPPESSRVDTQDNSEADAETRTLRGTAIEDVDARDIRALIGGVNFGTPGNRINRLFTGDAYGDVDPRPTEEKTGYIITGSADRRITYWDLSGKIERSVVLSGLEPGTEQPVFRQVNILTLVKYSTYAAAQNRTLRGSGPRPAQRTSLISGHQHQLLRAHQDCITALACLDSPFRGALVSGDRSGTIKVFRVDGD